MKCWVSAAVFLALCGTTTHAQAARRDVTKELTMPPNAPHIMEGILASEVARNENRKLSMAVESRQLRAQTPAPKKKSPKKKSRKISAAALRRKRARKAARIAARRRARRARRGAARRSARGAARRARKRQGAKDTPAGPTPGWIPAIGQTWNYDLGSPIGTDADVDVMVVDMAPDGIQTREGQRDSDQEAINTLHKQGKAVVCYISAGTLEAWRDDAHKFPDEAVGNFLEGVQDECWLDINHKKIRHVMKKRVEKAASMNCDAILPNAMMTYAEEDTGVSISKAEQIMYNIWFAKLVHDHGMLVGFKDARELVPLCYGDFDFAINFSCFEFEECNVYKNTFIKNGKPVFNAEFEAELDHCDDANKLNIDSIIKDVSLAAPFCSCSHPGNDQDCSAVLDCYSGFDDGTGGGGSCADYGGDLTSGSVCCPAACGQCGGEGCGGPEEGCCTSDAKDLCSDGVGAPCLLDA